MNAYASLFLVLRTAHSKAPVRHFLFNEKLKTLSFSPSAINRDPRVRSGKDLFH
jgi:hypothetical protein